MVVHEPDELWIKISKHHTSARFDTNNYISWVPFE